ncbi:hypothetical protein [Streptomyces millisiae]|uniref:Uncharacterized protein n=1 Tax=Streptomyces millisiae TaxID=3075542 RepID=A0ABU2LW98_9ACTN|nr:hypothetical protein [Streptomyces sp. DSM 44918]MDT0321864.1 hypothetical protein [Streptomyces sp. DSM 44918]
MWSFFRDHPGMIAQRFEHLASYLDGYDLGATRHGGQGLGTWRQWLSDLRDADCAFGWRGHVMHLAGLNCADLHRLTPGQERLVIDVALELLDQYLAGTAPATTPAEESDAVAADTSDPSSDAGPESAA